MGDWFWSSGEFGIGDRVTVSTSNADVRFPGVITELIPFQGKWVANVLLDRGGEARDYVDNLMKELMNDNLCDDYGFYMED